MKNLDPDHQLFGARLKLDRAREQLNALNSSIQAYFDSKPYTILSEVDPNTEILWRTIRIDKPCNPLWSAMVAEIVHHLRSALDYLVFEVIVHQTGAEPVTKKTQFPIFESESGFNSRGVPTMLRGVSPTAVTLIKSLQPFATGEGRKSPLWHLQEFSNRDKHRKIVLACTAVPEASSSAAYQAVDSNFMLAVGMGGLIEGKAPLFGRSVPPGPESLLERAAKVQVHGDATIHVTFKDPIVDPNLGAQAILAIIGKRVQTIVERVNSEFFS